MLSRTIALTISLALTAVPSEAQTGHEHDHSQESDSSAEQNQMTREMMKACPFHQDMGMPGEMMDMMGDGMMDHDMMSGMKGNGPGMVGRGLMGANLPSAPELISRRDDLDLSDGQVAALETLHDRVLKAVRVQLEMSRGAKNRATESIEQNPEGFDDFSEELRSAGTHMVEAHILMIQARFDAQKELTPEQKKAVSRAPSGMHQSMNMGGGMTGAEIMRGMMVSGSRGTASSGKGCGDTPPLD